MGVTEAMIAQLVIGNTIGVSLNVKSSMTGFLLPGY